MRVGIYARVSTDNDQTPETQLNILRPFALGRGWEIAGEYIDDGVSGSKTSRPALDCLMADARKGRLDGVLVFRFDRFSRDLQHLIAALEEFQHLKVAFVSYSEQIDTSSPAGRALFSLVGVFAEFMRSLTIENVKAGLLRAKQRGTRSGQAIGRPRRIFDRDKARRLLNQGLSERQVAAELGIGRGTLRRAVNGRD